MESFSSFRITVSIGVTQYRAREEISTILNRADMAIYEAKARGRNRVVSDPKPDPTPTDKDSVAPSA